jgi:hypothetical protein
MFLKGDRHALAYFTDVAMGLAPNDVVSSSAQGAPRPVDPDCGDIL